MDFTTGGRFEVSITPADVGKRVSVRYRYESAKPQERFTDAVGVLTSWTDEVLQITPRSGDTVRIPEAALVAGKVVPATPVRRRGPAADARELDRVAARAWPPLESEALGEWRLRAAGGFTRRANSVLALGDPGLPLDAALERVTAWYGERGLPAYLQLSAGAAGTQEWLAAELQARGWVREVNAEIRVGALAPVADLTDDTGRVTLSRDLPPGWLDRYQRFLRPGPEVVQVLYGGPSVWFATVPAGADTTGGPAPSVTGPAGGTGGAGTAGGAEGAGGTGGAEPAEVRAPAAIGRCVVDGRWAGFTAVEVAPESRRQGLATEVMAALARQALAEGASAAYLQVEADNDGARALYDGMGFRRHHTYHHWRAPRPDQG
ncbi:GNAT family N-acetyltransferase [Streptomyces pactum]|uniref:GNAT family N-acetyltransferase n=1 Tax=Streptomyces pactum TaxID=68249 RepID=UPI0036F94CB0